MHGAASTSSVRGVGQGVKARARSPHAPDSFQLTTIHATTDRHSNLLQASQLQAIRWLNIIELELMPSITVGERS